MEAILRSGGPNALARKYAASLAQTRRELVASGASPEHLDIHDRLAARAVRRCAEEWRAAVAGQTTAQVRRGPRARASRPAPIRRRGSRRSSTSSRAGPDDDPPVPNAGLAARLDHLASRPLQPWRRELRRLAALLRGEAS